MIRRPPRSTHCISSAASDVYKRQINAEYMGIDVVDPYASSEEVHHEYGFHLADSNITDRYDAIIAAVSHRDYANLDKLYFDSIANAGCVFVDVKGIFRELRDSFTYWSLQPTSTKYRKPALLSAGFFVWVQLYGGAGMPPQP
eukprot:TRINITY_DN32858_c0_g1_i1.p2 TRINITY_DN32858_c0_g1~~TRINITY_DN32858_c0_g1_i1.p2  ORF type:complete len:143 (+),score=21.09 TRINITY_DN32858_c0_g1_i1:59-487(+)